MIFSSTPIPKKKSTLAMIPLTSLTIKQRFCLGKGNGMHYAPFSLGMSKFYSPAEIAVFQKTDDERCELAKLRKSHRKKWYEIFGTKRPTSGIVTRILSGHPAQDRKRDVIV